jgi:hypothetical protein
MKKLLIILLSLSQVAFGAKNNLEFDSYHDLVLKMETLRDEIGVDKLIESSDVFINAITDEVPTETQTYTYNHSEGRSDSGDIGVFASFDHSMNQSNKASFSLTKTKMVVKEKELVEQKNQAKIRESGLIAQLQQHLKENMSRIYQLKYLQAYGFSKLASGQWRNSLDRVQAIDALGSYITFRGKVNTTFCSTTNYASYSNSSSQDSSSGNSSSASLLFADYNRSWETSESSSSTTQFHGHSESSCNYNEKNISVDEQDSIFKYSLNSLDDLIHELKISAYVQAVFSFSENIHTFTFGNTFLTEDYGSHPFESN